MKKEFKSLKPTKTRKPSDEKIDEVLQELNSTKQQPASKKSPVTKSRKQKLIAFNVKLPENLYDALDEEARRSGLSKKAVLVNALWDKFRED